MFGIVARTFAAGGRSESRRAVRRAATLSALASGATLAFAANAFAISGKVINVGTPFESGLPGANKLAVKLTQQGKKLTTHKKR
jgi:hypothetical protein